MSPKSVAQDREQAARTSKGQSNRKVKDRGDRKIVFKSVLDNPFEVKWPIIPLNVQNAILARVINLLQDVGAYNLDKHKAMRKAKVTKARRDNRRKAAGESSSSDVMDVDVMQQPENEGENDPGTSTLTGIATTTVPAIAHAMTAGINEVTKRLEEQCRIPRQLLCPATAKASLNTSNSDHSGNGDGCGDGSAVEKGDDTAGSAPTSPSSCLARAPIRTVLVCRADIDPPLLVSHIPHLVAACNSNSSKDPNARVILVSLPKGAEATLAQTLGIRRVAVLAFDETLLQDESLSTLLSSVDTVVAPWLVGVGDLLPHSRTKAETTKSKHTQLLRRHLEPTHIKQLRTTAPKDMRAAKALRAKGRAEAKANQKARKEVEAMESLATIIDFS